MWTHVFREYLRQNETDRETVLDCLYWAQVESVVQKNDQKSRDTVPVSCELRLDHGHPISFSL